MRVPLPPPTGVCRFSLKKQIFTACRRSLQILFLIAACLFFSRIHSLRLPSCNGLYLQEVDGDVFPILNARLGAGGRYRAYPPRVPVESRYFTLMFIKISTVKVLDSGREVRGSADTEN